MQGVTQSIEVAGLATSGRRTMISKFLQDKEHLEMFITGAAGTGKTTALIEIVSYLVQHKINFKVCAYTHKAKDVLISKLPACKEEYIFTLHALLKKRPTINSKATKIESLISSKQYGEPETIRLLIVDEFSFVGEDDYMTIGDVGTKVLYVGDPAQLDPVKSFQAVVPREPYWIKLTVIHRQADSELLELLASVREGSTKLPDTYRVPHIANAYMASSNPSKILLAYTNKRVQQLNATIQGRKEPKVGDTIVIPTLRTTGTVTGILSYQPDTITVPAGVINRDTKFNPLRTVASFKGIKYYEIDNSYNIACLFGYSDALGYRKHIAGLLTTANAKKQNSKQQYKRYKTLEECVVTADFNHAFTVHKAQGQEWEEVYIDHRNILMARNTASKLLYVALSRGKKMVKYN